MSQYPSAVLRQESEEVNDMKASKEATITQLSLVQNVRHAHLSD